MPEQPVSRTTELVKSIARGDRLAADQLMAELYGEFRTLARRYLDREPRGHTLQPTALVNEVYLRLVDQTQVDWKGRTHFFALGAQAMRRVLVDHARRKGRLKRGGGLQRADHEAIQDLEKLDPRQARIVELRFFGGLGVAEVAELLGLSRRTVEAEWTMIRAWLRRRLSDEDPR